MLASSISIMFAGFTLGFIHALDADHVMAVTALSNEKPSLQRTLKFSGSWAIGHGGVLLLAGMVLFGLGIALPANLIWFAELSVGIVLIAVGLLCFWRFRQQNMQLQSHKHGDVEHTHWHDHNHPGDYSQRAHAPVMVGMLHGLAGSAPALALIPAVAQGQLWVAGAYLVVFSVGVMLSMMLFGAGLGMLQKQLQQRFSVMFNVSRYLIASFSVAFGGYWVLQAV
jgi:ABC-type nickel/cobalt efflux system permease component RcnA